MENSTIAVNIPEIRPEAVPRMKNLRFRAAVLAVAAGILGAELIPVDGIKTVKIQEDVPDTETLADNKSVPGNVKLTSDGIFPQGVDLTDCVMLPGCTDLENRVTLLEVADPAENVMLPEGMELAGNGTFSGYEDTKAPVILPEQEDAAADVIYPESEDTTAGVILPDHENIDGDIEGDGRFPEKEDAEGDGTGFGDEHVSDNPVTDGESGNFPEEENSAGKPVSVSGFLIDSEGMICGMDASTVAVEDGYLELPAEGCSGIRSGALSETASGIVEIYIPSNIVVVEEGAFSSLCQLEWIEAAGGNAGCMSIDGVLFDGSGTTLLAFPGGRTDRYSVPESVTKIAGGAFANACVSGLDFWMCGPVEIGTGIFGSHNGNGMEIRVPEEYADWYQNHFAGYDVQIL